MSPNLDPSPLGETAKVGKTMAQKPTNSPNIPSESVGNTGLGFGVLVLDRAQSVTFSMEQGFAHVLRP